MFMLSKLGTYISMEAVKMIVEFNVPIRQLWNAWTIPSITLKWFGSDPDGKGVDAKIDATPQGKYSITFADRNGVQHTCFGTFLEVKKYENLAFTWEWKSEPGHVSHVKIRFAQNNESSTMEFEHSKLNPESLHGYAAGWERTFEKLRGVVSNE
jgi:uncharacterized protein YndB with AHSA1/START domain